SSPRPDATAYPASQAMVEFRGSTASVGGDSDGVSGLNRFASSSSSSRVRSKPTSTGSGSAIRELLPELSDLFLHGADSHPQVFVDRIVNPFQGITSSARRPAPPSSRHRTPGIGVPHGIGRATRSVFPGPRAARGFGGADREDARPGLPSGGPSLSLDSSVSPPISAGATRLGETHRAQARGAR